MPSDCDPLPRTIVMVQLRIYSKAKEKSGLTKDGEKYIVCEHHKLENAEEIRDRRICVLMTPDRVNQKTLLE
jgi:hypothetical protein